MTSKKEKYALAVGETDLKRMSMLGKIYMPYCKDFLLTNGLAPGMTVADIGCGPGNVTLWLAEQVGSIGKVMGIDNSDEQLAILNKKITEQGINNVTTYKIDIYEADQIKEHFDLIFCRFLFIHLSNPILAIRKLFGLLKPNGRLILENNGEITVSEADIFQNSTSQVSLFTGVKPADF